MYGEYRKRSDTAAHQFLDEDHLCFRHLGQADKGTHPLNTCAFSMEAGHVRSEGLWGTVSTIARFSHMLDQRRRISTDEHSDNEGGVNKRLRVTQLFQEYLRHVLEPRSNAKRAALQVVAFMVQEGSVDEDDLLSMIEKLISCISDENPAHSVWAMSGLAGYVFDATSLFITDFAGLHYNKLQVMPCSNPIGFLPGRVHLEPQLQTQFLVPLVT